MITIYALCCPVTNEIRYVGKTNNPKQRYKEHCSAKKNCYVNHWIRKLRPNRPLMIELEQASSLNTEWIEAEQFWIAYFKYLGARLANITKGGEGMCGFTLSLATRLKISQSLTGSLSPWFGRKHSNSTKQLMSVKSVGTANSAAILTDNIVFNMRLDKKNGLTYDQLVHKYNIKRSTISMAVSGINWRHVLFP